VLAAQQREAQHGYADAAGLVPGCRRATHVALFERMAKMALPRVRVALYQKYVFAHGEVRSLVQIPSLHIHGGNS